MPVLAQPIMVIRIPRLSENQIWARIGELEKIGTELELVAPELAFYIYSAFLSTSQNTGWEELLWNMFPDNSINLSTQ